MVYIGPLLNYLDTVHVGWPLAIHNYGSPVEKGALYGVGSEQTSTEEKIKMFDYLQSFKNQL